MWLHFSEVDQNIAKSNICRDMTCLQLDLVDLLDFSRQSRIQVWRFHAELTGFMISATKIKYYLTEFALCQKHLEWNPATVSVLFMRSDGATNKVFKGGGE